MVVRPLVALLLCLLPLAAAAQPSETEGRLAAVRARIGELRDVLLGDRDSRAQLQAELAALEAQQAGLRRERRELAAAVQAQQRRLQTLEQTHAEELAQLASRREALAAQLRAIQQQGGPAQVKLLLGGADPAASARLLGYYGYLEQAQRRRIEALSTALAALEQTRVQVDEARRQLLQARERQQVLGARLEALAATRGELLARLERKIAGQEDELARLREDERRLETLLKALPPELAALKASGFSAQQGQLPWPVQGKLLAGFRSAAGGKLRRPGWLIGGKRGDPVRAVARGRVQVAQPVGGFGLLLVVDHGEGYLSLYGHNEQLFVAEGEWVETGETIAALGSSGGRSTPAAYFEIRRDTRPQDPARWLRRAG